MEEIKIAAEAKLGGEVEVRQWVIPCQLDLEGSIPLQCEDLMQKAHSASNAERLAAYSRRESVYQIIVPPAFSSAAFYIGARMASAQSDAYPPSPCSFLWLIRDGASLPPQFKIGGIVW
jgi:hypothetical protein